MKIDEGREARLRGVVRHWEHELAAARELLVRTEVCLEHARHALQTYQEESE